MIEISFSPGWFYGFDILIDAISIFVLALIAWTGLKYYLIGKKNKNFITLVYSFFMLAAALLFKILTNFTIYYTSIKTKQIGIATFTFETMKSVDTLFFIGYFMYRLLTLVGLYLFFNLYDKQSRSSSVIIIFLILVSTYFAQSAFYTFYFTALLLFSLISYKYWRDHYTKSKSSKLLLISIITLSISQLLFILIAFDKVFYAIAEIAQLVGYSLLLFTFLLVLKHGKKKKQIRHNN